MEGDHYFSPVKAFFIIVCFTNGNSPELPFSK
jgi:hypothetical protein